MKRPNFKQFFVRLHKCERGDIPVGPIMIIGLIVIPIVIGLVLFRDNLTGYLQTQWDTFTGTEKEQQGIVADP